MLRRGPDQGGGDSHGEIVERIGVVFIADAPSRERRPGVFKWVQYGETPCPGNKHRYASRKRSKGSAISLVAAPSLVFSVCTPLTSSGLPTTWILRQPSQFAQRDNA